MAVTKTRKRTWICFFGTQAALVHAVDEDAAFNLLVAELVGLESRYGRLTPPGRDEVHIRPPRDSDRGWIEDSGDRKWFEVLNDITSEAGTS